MTPEVRGHSEFDKWLRQWLAKIEKNHVVAEDTPPEKINSAAEHEDSSHANTTAPGNAEQAA